MALTQKELTTFADYVTGNAQLLKDLETLSAEGLWTRSIEPNLFNLFDRSLKEDEKTELKKKFTKLQKELQAGLQPLKDIDKTKQDIDKITKYFVENSKTLDSPEAWENVIQPKLSTILGHTLEPEKEQALHLQFLRVQRLQKLESSEIKPTTEDSNAQIAAIRQQRQRLTEQAEVSKEPEIKAESETKFHPEQVMQKGIEKNLEQIRNLYRNELENRIQKEQNSIVQQELKDILKNLSTIELKSEEYLAYYNQQGSYTILPPSAVNYPNTGELRVNADGRYIIRKPLEVQPTFYGAETQYYHGSLSDLKDVPGVLSTYEKTQLQAMLSDLNATLQDSTKSQTLNNFVLKILSKRGHIPRHTEQTFAKHLSQFVLNKATADSRMDFSLRDVEKSLRAHKSLQEQVSRNFTALSAPSSHRELIEQLSQYTEKLEQELNNLTEEMTKPGEHPFAEMQAQRQKETILKNKLNLALALHDILVNRSPTILQGKTTILQKELDRLKTKPDKYGEKDELIDILEKTLKINEPAPKFELSDVKFSATDSTSESPPMSDVSKILEKTEPETKAPKPEASVQPVSEEKRIRDYLKSGQQYWLDNLKNGLSAAQIWRHLIMPALFPEQENRNDPLYKEPKVVDTLNKIHQEWIQAMKPNELAKHDDTKLIARIRDLIDQADKEIKAEDIRKLNDIGHILGEDLQKAEQNIELAQSAMTNLQEAIENNEDSEALKKLNWELESLLEMHYDIPTLKRSQTQLKRAENFIAKYIEELSNLKTTDKTEKDWLKEQIKGFKNTKKDLRDPESNMRKLMTQSIISNEQLLDILNEALIENEDSPVPDSMDKNKLQTIKQKVAEHFLISSRDADQPPPPEQLLQSRSQSPPPVPKTGAAILLSKIAGTPKKTAFPENRTIESIQKDIEQIRSLYRQEIQNEKIKSLWRSHPNTSDMFERIISTLDQCPIDPSKFLEQYKSKEDFSRQLTQYIDSTIQASMFSELGELEKIYTETPDLIHKLNDRVAKKFREKIVPSSHQNLIKQLNEYTEKLEPELDNLNKELLLLKDSGITANLDRQMILNHKLAFASKISDLLTEPYPNIAQLREILEQSSRETYGKKDKLTEIIDATLKINDPYYEDIKKLDKFIQDNPSNATKLEIAQNVREMLIHPSTRIVPANGIARVEKHLTVEKLKAEIGKNPDKNKGNLFGKEKLDGILQDILKKTKESKEAPAPTRGHRP